MNKYKKALITNILFGILFLSIGLFFIIGGAVRKSKVFYFGIIWTVLYAGLYTWRIVSLVKKRHLAKLDGVRILSEQELLLADKYNKVTNFGDVGFVSFIHAGLKFAAEGTFACVKDFNNLPGYHFAFNVIGTKLVDKPHEYDDVLHYEECLFSIELACFDGVKLSEENNNGIVLDSIDNLQGKTIQLKKNSGYVAQIATVEWDEINYGEITFEQWDENAHIISFKLLATAGVSEVITGKVKLLEDTE